jgi:hypothetical protein
MMSLVKKSFVTLNGWSTGVPIVVESVESGVIPKSPARVGGRLNTGNCLAPVSSNASKFVWLPVVQFVTVYCQTPASPPAALVVESPLIASKPELSVPPAPFQTAFPEAVPVVTVPPGALYETVPPLSRSKFRSRRPAVPGSTRKYCVMLMLPPLNCWIVDCNEPMRAPA